MKPVRWIERLPTQLKSCSIHAKMIDILGYEEYLRQGLWRFSDAEAGDFLWSKDLMPFTQIINTKCISVLRG